MKNNHVGVYLWAPVLLAVGLPKISAAQQGDNNPFEEIMVTATKREESIYDVPIAVSAFSGDALAAQGTLYGRNSIGGAVNIITKTPGVDPGARVSLEAGSRGRLNGHFYADWNLTDNAAIYGRNITDERYTNALINLGDYILQIMSNDASEFGLSFTKSF